ncbi:daunorubicin resistance protein DrrA family ABC transporter ATP-binding protein [Leifsonia aquatica]|uniref:Daunorubicin resistance ABC transporter, ATP-binding protein n=2 Tax=Leifsonia aquatica TaxID=144185 RepID=U2TEN4_LEIAQ|nr:daunorubicin resistance protein DrrA family ABC transporter ATP-binding protein [Leifsonia aquatica]ERK73147.1 daunorubicin resistance ABC transporter, ATP-binding protein [Leifsonia aquatica ATCC 14665]MBB2965810.1 ABC-2 type transport system ATP-binding protein [Leifsonia aquatica]
MTTAAIEVEGLRKSFGTQTVLDGIDLRVEAGSVFALLGPNGAGKTTLISILSTLVDPDGGVATVCGHDVVADREGVKESISLTGQSAAVDGVLTGEENLRMMARLSGFSATGARRRASELLESFDLTGAARKRVATYSGGMRRRLDLALSLVATPPVIFLDEPTTGLDTRSRQALWDIIDGLARAGTTILLTTQYLEEADHLADRIAVLDHGVIVAEGTAAELKALVGGEVVELRGPDDEVLRELPTDGTVDGLRAAIEELDDLALPGASIGIRKPSLDDAFLALTNQKEAVR